MAAIAYGKTSTEIDKGLSPAAETVTVVPVLDDDTGEPDEKRFDDEEPDQDRQKGTLNEGRYDWTSPEFADIPELVRNTVSFEDDPTIRCWTFRVAVLSTLFAIIGSTVSVISFFRTTFAPFPVFFVILASRPLGQMMATYLPDKKIKIWRWSFSLNPGPFTNKEHVLIGIIANVRSHHESGDCAILRLVRPILVQDPRFIFPISLQQVTVYRSMQATQDAHLGIAKKQMKVFWIVLGGMFCWQFLPEWMMPFVASLAPLCWFASHNHTANFLGAGRGGIGLPYSVQVVLFVSFVITTWILIPVAYFGNLWGSPTYDIMSNGVFTKNGSAYPEDLLVYTDASGQQVF